MIQIPPTLLLLEIVSLPIEIMAWKGLWSTHVRFQKHTHIDVMEFDDGSDKDATQLIYYMVLAHLN